MRYSHAPYITIKLQLSGSILYLTNFFSKTYCSRVIGDLQKAKITFLAKSVQIQEEILLFFFFIFSGNRYSVSKKIKSRLKYTYIMWLVCYPNITHFFQRFRFQLEKKTLRKKRRKILGKCDNLSNKSAAAAQILWKQVQDAKYSIYPRCPPLSGAHSANPHRAVEEGVEVVVAAESALCVISSIEIAVFKFHFYSLLFNNFCERTVTNTNGKMANTIKCTVVVVGDALVGKSALINRLIHNEFHEVRQIFIQCVRRYRLNANYICN